MKRYTFLLIILLSCLFAVAQEDDTDNDPMFPFQIDKLYLNEPDSVRIGWYYFSDKEYMGEAYDENEGDKFELLDQAFLTKKEIKNLNKYLVSKQSYCGSIALLAHVDIEFLYYKDGVVMQKIWLSSFTRDIIIFDRNEEIFIKNSVHKKFHHFVAGLLKKHKFWSNELQFNFYENYDGDCS